MHCPGNWELGNEIPVQLTAIGDSMQTGKHGRDKEEAGEPVQYGYSFSLSSMKSLPLSLPHDGQL